MFSNIKIPSSYRTGSQSPLDNKGFFENKNDMIDVANYRPLSWYKNMKAIDMDSGIYYTWKESVSGVIDGGYTYPNNVISFGIVYSLKTYNFVLFTEDSSAYPTFDSAEEAFQNLGLNKNFYWSQNNTDGVPSPNGSIVGITKEPLATTSLIDNSGIANVIIDPNLIIKLQGAHKIKLAVLTDGSKIWNYVESNIPGKKWVQLGHFPHDQLEPSAVWTMNHPLKKFPSVVTTDLDGYELYGKVQYIDINTVQVTFSGGFSGYGYLN
jgi:hypothetical protein